MNTKRLTKVFAILVFSVSSCGAAEDKSVVLANKADDPRVKPREWPSDSVYRELLAGIPKKSNRAKSAKLELEYWHKHEFLTFPPVRKHVTTKDGKAAEVVFLRAPSWLFHGPDFSMAFLLVEKRVIDWVSCWTHDRFATQELLLEDVDGDGFQDVAFRPTEVWCRQLNKRLHSCPNSKAKWLYAYGITEKGFESIFPSTDRDMKVKLSYDTVNQPVSLEVKGLPDSLRERQLVQCTITLTNNAKSNVALKAGGWFTLETGEANWFMEYTISDKRDLLKPGESVSQIICLFIEDKEKEKEVVLRWRFVPEYSAPAFP
ncbi:MAG: hypothetical protein ACJ8FY_20495 [Gemmataceae bacterium]